MPWPLEGQASTSSAWTLGSCRDLPPDALPAGMATLAGLPGVSVVSVSYGFFDDADVQQMDSTYLQPAVAAHPNVSFFVKLRRRRVPQLPVDIAPRWSPWAALT